MLCTEWVGVMVTADGALLHARSDIELLVGLPEAHDLWQALVLGHVHLEEHFTGGRHYLVVPNAPADRSFRAVTRAELDVVEQAAQGTSTKLIAYTFGLSFACVSLRLARTATKTGLRTRSELVRLAAMLTRDPCARSEEPALTRIERQILELVRHGFSNRAIAEIRGRSERTIANQVAKLLRKTKASSRRELLTRH